ncbi:g5773 [Coccomyxa viridis]|uniref:G5773 protein n=1 Tax=Coccomyxa viridis TaxID=1274662 RepID=A0ABP1FTM5_9CHLO
MCPNSAAKRNWNYKLTNNVKEEHGHPIYCVAFNFIGDCNNDIFASCGATRATIYRCHAGGKIEIVQAYLDDDENEEFYAVKWSVNVSTGAPLLLLAGKRGLLKVLDTETETLTRCLEGHGDAINDISVHPLKHSLVLTASRDSALRLWNIETNVCVLIIHGDGGHLNEVLSIDFHPFHGEQFLSSGMDNTVKIWSLTGMQEHIESSYAHDASKGKVFHTRQLACPTFSSHKVHFNYVDCVRWMGDLIVSKSVKDRIFVWQPDVKDDIVGTKGLVHLLHEMDMEDAHVWFVRFAMDKRCRTLACGNRQGTVFVWDPQDMDRKPAARLRREAPPASSRAHTTTRQTAVSADGSTIISCCDDSTIWRWDVQGA